MSQLKPGYADCCHNYFPVTFKGRVTHLRLNMYPGTHPHARKHTLPHACWSAVGVCVSSDGGIARLRVFGVGETDWSSVSSNHDVDLLALVNGGVCLAYSDAHFGHPRNMIGTKSSDDHKLMLLLLLLEILLCVVRSRPSCQHGGRVGDGTASGPPQRTEGFHLFLTSITSWLSPWTHCALSLILIQVDQRGILQVPGREWAVFRLGHPGVISSIEVDTNHFKGATSVWCLIAAKHENPLWSFWSR